MLCRSSVQLDRVFQCYAGLVEFYEYSSRNPKRQKVKRSAPLSDLCSWPFRLVDRHETQHCGQGFSNPLSVLRLEFTTPHVLLVTDIRELESAIWIPLCCGYGAASHRWLEFSKNPTAWVTFDAQSLKRVIDTYDDLFRSCGWIYQRQEKEHCANPFGLQRSHRLALTVAEHIIGLRTVRQRAFDQHARNVGQIPTRVLQQASILTRAKTSVVPLMPPSRDRRLRRRCPRSPLAGLPRLQRQARSACDQPAEWQNRHEAPPRR